MGETTKKSVVSQDLSPKHRATLVVKVKGEGEISGIYRCKSCVEGRLTGAVTFGLWIVPAVAITEEYIFQPPSFSFTFLLVVPHWPDPSESQGMREPISAILTGQS